MSHDDAPRSEFAALAPKLGAAAREHLARHRAAFADAIRRGAKGVDSAAAFARALDGMFQSMFLAADAATRGLPGGGRVALVAVGGYGRGLVALHGDADLLLLADDPSAPRVEALAEVLLYPLWDVGFDVGHVVRTADETVALARDDVRTATTLLDLRAVAGDLGLVRDLVRDGRRHVFEPHLTNFLEAMEKEAHGRQARFGDSLFLLEPEVKQGRGGLRDLDIADWAGRAGFGVDSNEELVRVGAYLPRELKQVQSAREFLWRVRNHLHLRAKRRQDRLTFADQEDIAAELGFVDGITLGVEQFMQAYYRHARLVAQLSERMLDRARPQKRRNKRTQTADLGDGTVLFDDTVNFAKTERLAEDPTVALRLYRQVARNTRPPHANARDAVQSHCEDRGFRGRLLRSEEATQLFLDLLVFTGEVPVRHGSLVRELHETGLLLAMIPEFEPLMGRVHHDVYHVYTVDVHVVHAVDRLRSFFRGELFELLPSATRLAAEVPQPLPLFVATLLHAIGKARGGDWLKNGASTARDIAIRLGLGTEDADYVAFLVREQGTLYRMATQRDTRDPEALADVVKIVGTPERLRELFLVNVAILSTVSPSAMTQWKARMLDDLLHNALAELAGAGEGAVDARAIAVRDRARAACQGHEEALAFLGSMPDRYLLGHPLEAILRHAVIDTASADRDVFVVVTPDIEDDLTEVVVVTADRPGLLADAAAVLAKHRLGIVDAQIFTQTARGHARAFDIFHVQADSSAARDPEALALRLEDDLRSLLRGGVDASEWIAKAARVPSWAQRHSPDVPTEVFVDNEISSRFTIVDVFTRDRVGLLHVIASTLHAEGLSISLSKVNTEGDRVADVFYVQTRDGRKLDDTADVRRLRDALFARISAFHEAVGGTRP